MTEACKNCGSALIAGARFCRFCGHRTGDLLDEERPTRTMPPAEQYNPAGATGPQFGAGPAYYPPAHPPKAVVKSRPVWGWIVGLIALMMMGVLFLGIFFFARSSRSSRGERSVRGTPAPPPLPARPGDFPFADTVVQTYRLRDNATISVKSFNGDITIEGWDGPDAEVKLMKRGGSEQARRALRVSVTETNGDLSLSTIPALGEGARIDYAIKIPRDAGRIVIASMNSDVKLSDLSSEIVVEIQNGSVELSECTGGGRTKVTNGGTKITLEEGELAGGLELTSVNGGFEVKLGSNTEVDLTAETKVGRISLDEEFGIDVVRGIVGQRAEGKIGAGGRPLRINTVSGSIKIEK